MPRRSITPIADQELDGMLEDFYELFTTLSKTDLKQFMKEFLTSEEQVMVSKRFALYKLLFQEMDPVDVQQALGMSKETVRVYSHMKFHRSDLFKSVIEKQISKTKTKQTLAKIGKALKPLENALNAKSDMRARSDLFFPDND